MRLKEKYRELERRWKEKMRKLTFGYEYAYGRGYSFPPLSISIMLTYHCNLRCVMCWQYGEKGVFKRLTPEIKNKTVSLENWKKVVDNFFPHWKPRIFLWGGEPFLYSGLLEFVQYMEEKGLPCIVNTNGTFLAEKSSEIVSSGLDSFLISIDGVGEVHNSIRKGGNSYQKIVEGITAVQKLKREKGRMKPKIILNCTINPLNVRILPEMVRLADKLRVDFLQFSHIWFTSQSLGEEYAKILKEEFNCEATSWQGFVRNGFVDLNLAELVQQLQFLKRISTSVPIDFLPNLKPEQVIDYYRNPSRIFFRSYCLSPWMEAAILPNGDVTPCTDRPDFIVGNVLEEPLPLIWNNQRFRSFRRRLREKGIFPICPRCCGFYYR